MSSSPKPTIGQAHDLMMLLNKMDADVESGRLILSGPARIANLVNARLLAPLALAFEQTRNERFKEILPPDFDLSDLGKDNPNTPLHPATQQKLIAILMELRAPVCEIALQTFTIADLCLDKNPYIGRVTLETLSPVINDLPSTAVPAKTPLTVVKVDDEAAAG